MIVTKTLPLNLSIIDSYLQFQSHRRINSNKPTYFGLGAALEVAARGESETEITASFCCLLSPFAL